MKVSDSQVYEFADFRLDADKRLLIKGGSENLPLTSKVFDTLLFLVEHRGKVVEKDDLLSGVWPDAIVEENNLSQNISILRRVLGEKRSEHRYIITIPGKGYKFVAPVRVAPASDGSAVTVSKKELTLSGAHDGYDFERKGNVLAIADWTDNDRGRSEDAGLPSPAKKTKRWPIPAATIVCILILGSLGLYLWRVNSQPASGQSKTIAVLPFKPLVTEDRDEALELGMADALISRLSNNRSLQVRPISSVRHFNSPDQDPIAAGQALGVELVLESSLQRSGENIRVNVSLIRVADGTPIWAKPFDKKFTDIFDVQDEIATRIVDALDFQLTGDEKARLEKRFTNNADAYEYYLRGRSSVYKVTEEGISQGIAFYEQAVKADPNYALAYAEMADAYRRLAVAGFARPQAALPQAEAFARKAMDLDGSLATPYVVLAWLDFVHYWNWASAETRFKHALELEPNNSDARIAYALYLSSMKRHEEAVAEGHQARELSPLTPIFLAFESQVLNTAGHEDEAMLQAKKALDFDSDFWPARVQLGEAYRRQKRYSEAVAENEKARELAPASFSPFMWAPNLYRDMGDTKRLSAVLDELERRSKHEFVPFHLMAKYYNALGQKDKALDLLERSLEDREVHLVGIFTDSGWDNLRSDARFVAILRKMNVND